MCGASVEAEWREGAGCVFRVIMRRECSRGVARGSGLLCFASLCGANVAAEWREGAGCVFRVIMWRECSGGVARGRGLRVSRHYAARIVAAEWRRCGNCANRAASAATRGAIIRAGACVDERLREADDGGRAVFDDLPPRNRNHMDAAGGEARGAAAVALEACARGVMPIPVDFHGNALVRPEEIDLVAFNRDVRHGDR